MRKILRQCILLCLCILFSVSEASADFLFSDDRFQGIFTTENLDAISEEYELYDGWYWTTVPHVQQTFHGAENAPGWTDTSANKLKKKGFLNYRFGCRWFSNQVFAAAPNSGGYGECFGFAQFVGYLLSGEYNPQKNWNYYYMLDQVPGGLQVGDIVRTSFNIGKKTYQHSAVVYSVSEDEILFLQVSGGSYNRIVLSGFSDGYHQDVRTEEGINLIPNKKICRSQLNSHPAP